MESISYERLEQMKAEVLQGEMALSDYVELMNETLLKQSEQITELETQIRICKMHHKRPEPVIDTPEEAALFYKAALKDAYMAKSLKEVKRKISNVLSERR